MIFKNSIIIIFLNYLIKPIKNSCQNVSQYLLENTTLCVERNKFPNYYIDGDTLKKCEHPCYECLGSSDEENQNCLSCLRGYEFDSSRNKCIKCPKNKYKYIYSSYDTCNYSNKEFCKKEITKCTVYTDKLFKGCPIEIPILIQSKKMCVGKNICTDEEFSDNNCIMSNINLIKSKISNPTYFPENKELVNKKNIGVAVDNSGNLLFESNSDYDTKRYYYGISQINGRENFTDENNKQTYENSFELTTEPINKTSSNIIEFIDNVFGGKYFISIFLSNTDIFMELSSLVFGKFDIIRIRNLDLYDFMPKDKKNRIENYKMVSTINPIIFFYFNDFTFYVFGFLGVSPSNENCLFLFYIQNFISFLLFDYNLLLVTKIFEINEVQKFERISLFSTETYQIILLYLDINFELRIFISNYTSSEDIINVNNPIIGKSLISNYFSCFHLIGETGVFLFFNDESSKLTISIKTINYDSNSLEDYLSGVSNFVINSQEKYPISYFYLDTESIKIDSTKFAVISKYISKEKILIIIFKIINNNDDNNKIIVNYYQLSLNDNEIEINNIFKLFVFKGLLGLYFYNNKNLFPGFMIFGYANSKDPEPIEDFFYTTDDYKIKFEDYIKIENNIYGYELKGIKILSKPNSEESGIYLYSSDYKEIKENNILDYTDLIYIAHLKDFVLPGNYSISFVPISKDPSSFSIYNFYIENKEIFGGELINQEEYYLNNIEEYEGRVVFFNFTVENFEECLSNCKICNKNQCFECLELNHYPAEKLKECYTSSPENNYYFNETINVYLFCYETCKICDGSYYEMTDNHNCLECRDNFIKMEGTKNCYDKNEEIEGYIKYEDEGIDIFRKCDEHCETCFAPPNDENNYNCLTCDIEENYLLFNKSNNCLTCFYRNKIANYEQTKCIFENEIPDGYYLEENKIVEKCYDNCKTCSSGPIYQDMNKTNVLNMSCDSCDNDNNYYFMEKEKNKFYDCYFESDIPKNYYKKLDIINNETKYYKCYELCQNCSGRGTNNDMKCSSCLNEIDYELKKGNCYKKKECPNYYLRNVTNGNLKECLEENEICINDYPFLMSIDKECVINCTYEDLINKNCLSTNFPKALQEVHKIINVILEYSKNNLNIENEYNDLLIEGLEVEYLLTTNINHNKLDFDNDIKNYSFINFGDCERLLKKEYNLNENDPLFIYMVNIKRNDTPTMEVEYEIYNPFNLSKALDLSICKNIPITINSPIFLSDEQFNKYKNAKNQGYDIYNPNDFFYNNICTPFDSQNYVDININDRKNNYYDKDLKLCESNCKYEGINFITKKVICNCTIKTKMTLLDYFTKINFEPNVILESFYQVMNYSNLKVLKCYSLVFNINNLKKNIGSYFMLALICLFLISAIYGIISNNKNIKKIFINIFTLINNLIESPYNDNNEKDRRNVYKRKTARNKKATPEKGKIKKIHFYPPIKKKKNKNIKNQENKIYNNNKIYIYNINHIDDKINQDNKNNNKIKRGTKRLRSYQINNNNNMLNSTNNKLIDNVFKSRYSGKLKSIKNLNKKDSQIDSNKCKKKFKNNGKKKSIKDKKENKEIKNLSLENIIDMINPKDRYKYLIDIEINYLTYEYAIEIDKRTFFEYYWSLLKTKHLIILTFINQKDYNLFSIKFCLFICSFAIYFTVNGFFFTDNTMHKIYKNNGYFNIFYQIYQILFSSLICSIISIILKKLSLYQDNILILKNFNTVHRAQKETKKIYNCIRIKFGLFILLGLILLGFCWYYITAFCCVFRNTQIHLIKSIILSFIISMLYPLVLNLLPAILRIPSLRDKQKSKKCLYNTSKIISLIS